MCHLYIGVPLLSCFSMLITSQMRQESPQRCSPPVQPLGQLKSSFLRYRYYESWFGKHIVGKPLKKETSKTLRMLTGHLILSLPLSFLPSMIITKYGENILIWWNNTFLWMVIGWKPSYSRCSFSYVSVLPSCWNKLLQKQLTSFHSCWIYSGNSSLIETRYPVPLFHTLQ